MGAVWSAWSTACIISSTYIPGTYFLGWICMVYTAVAHIAKWGLMIGMIFSWTGSGPRLTNPWSARYVNSNLSNTATMPVWGPQKRGNTSTYCMPFACRRIGYLPALHVTTTRFYTTPSVKKRTMYCRVFFLIPKRSLRLRTRVESALTRKKKKIFVRNECLPLLNPFRAAVPFWGQVN